ncbi:hypothetical protein HY416_00460 [Candidatus Kaiserbacteria bacterium]|nr:hypothetical protein [Candidatus Kaiserbacteria bacterium]
MIDTVILSVPRDKVITLDETARGVAPWDLHERTQSYSVYVKNPSSKDKATGLSFPRLTGWRRRNYGGIGGWTSVLKIEFSVAKLLYKNNVDELEDGQFALVVDTLLDRLDRMGVRIQRQDIELAEVRAVHYAKNIELTSGYTSLYALGELGKVNITKRLDMTKTRFVNDGESLCFYAKSHSVVLYDKIADLRKNQKRAVDLEQTAYQMSLFPSLNNVREILRLEVRLSEKRKMSSVFQKLGIPENPTFKDVFCAKKSQMVVRHYWDTMIEGNSLLLFSHSLTAKDLLKQILIARPDAKATKPIYLAGLVLLAREGNGLRELRTILAKRSNDRLWYRLRTDLADTTAGLDRLRPREWYDQVKGALESYQPVHLHCKE